jgi:hypothetical protein
LTSFFTAHQNDAPGKALFIRGSVTVFPDPALWRIAQLEHPGRRREIGHGLQIPNDDGLLRHNFSNAIIRVVVLLLAVPLELSPKTLHGGQKPS